jgi:predicted transcriptional regulator
VAEFPLTAGVVGAVFAPVLAAIGALAALIKECTIAVERDAEAAPAPAAEEASAPADEPPAAEPPAGDEPAARTL